MNNLPNQANTPPVQTPQAPSQTPPQQQPVQQQYYQPPNYYQQYGYTGSAPSGSYYTKKPGYTLATEKALSSMNVPLFLIFSIFFGWICSRTVMTGHVGAGMTVMGILFYALFLPFYLRKREKKIPLAAWLLFIPQAAVFASFALYSGPRNKTAGLLLSLAIAAVQTTLIAGCTEGRPFSKELLSDTCAAYLAYPFLNLADTVKAVLGIGKQKSGSGKGKNASKILLGLAISIPVVLVLILLLSKADEMFSMWIETIIRVLHINFATVLAHVILTFIAMLYVMPLVVTLRAGYHSEYTEKSGTRPLDAIITTTVLFAASIVYITFVVVQFRYLFASGGKLPLGFTYAEYCRRGFFELVFVTAATTAVIAAVCMLTRHNDKDRLPVYTKAALLLISACGGVMIVSAAYRLVIYVREYGMTISRFNAAVVIAFMAVCILVMTLKILFENLKVSAVIGSTVIILAALYAVFNVDGFIARYNIDRYLNDTTQELDIDYIKYNLSAAALPELNRLAERKPDAETKTMVEDAAISICNYNYICVDNMSPADWTWDRFEAHKILKQLEADYNNRTRNSVSIVSESDLSRA